MRILIAEEKYGTRYLEANTDEELDKSCRKLIKERLKYNYYPKDVKEGMINVMSRGVDLYRGLPMTFIVLCERMEYEYECVQLEMVESNES